MAETKVFFDYFPSIQLSDELRDRIKELGYIVKDSKDGMVVEKGE